MDGGDEGPIYVARVRGTKFKAEQRLVYFAQAKTLGLVKIGVTNDATLRFASLQTACPDELEFLGVIRSAEAERLEGLIHYEYRHSRVRGEWFEPTSRLMAFIQRNAISIEDDRQRQMWAAVERVRVRTEAAMQAEAGAAAVAALARREGRPPVSTPRGRGRKALRVYLAARGLA